MLKAILVDDERSGREMLAAIIHESFSERVKVCALCSNVSEGLDAISVHQPDVVFLDIEMPNESGFELIERSTTLKSAVVFVTAYNHHAVHAFRVNALDYLLKPVQRGELLQVIERLEKMVASGKILARHELLQSFGAFAVAGNTKVGLPSLNGLIFIEVNDIIRCEADNNYCIIFTHGQRHIISRTLKDVEESLQQHNFFRVHKSHMVNLGKIVRYLKQDGGTLILADKSEVPVSRQSREELERRLLIL